MAADGSSYRPAPTDGDDVTSERERLLSEVFAPPTTGGRWFRTGEVAAVLQVSERAVRTWADEGRLVCARDVGGRRRFAAAVVREALARMQGEPVTRPRGAAGRR